MLLGFEHIIKFYIVIFNHVHFVTCHVFSSCLPLSCMLSSLEFIFKKHLWTRSSCIALTTCYNVAPTKFGCHVSLFVTCYRWIRYEEAVEEGGQRWSKPHVASLMMEALQDLQSILSTCPYLLNCTAMSMLDIAGNDLPPFIVLT